MSKQFPPEFIEAWKATYVKAAFILDEPPTLAGRDCENCGGRGFMSTFVAAKGPFNNPGSVNEVSHFHDGKWWVGKTITATCPVCHGNNAAPIAPPVEEPAAHGRRQQAGAVAERLYDKAREWSDQ